MPTGTASFPRPRLLTFSGARVSLKLSNKSLNRVAAGGPRATIMRKISGQVLIETAIILPLLLLLLFGMVDFSRAIYTHSTLHNAARSGARAAAVTHPLASTSPPAPLFSSSGEPAETIKSSLAGRVPENATVQYEVTILDSTGAPVTGNAHAGNQVRITLRYPDFHFITPVFNLLSPVTDHTPTTGDGSMAITAEVSMRYE